MGRIGRLTSSLVLSTNGCRQLTCQVTVDMQAVVPLVEGLGLKHCGVIASGGSPETGTLLLHWRRRSVFGLLTVYAANVKYHRLCLLRSQGKGDTNIVTNDNALGTHAIKPPVLELWIAANFIRKTGERRSVHGSYFVGVKHSQDDSDRVFICPLAAT